MGIMDVFRKIKKSELHTELTEASINVDRLYNQIKNGSTTVQTNDSVEVRNIVGNGHTMVTVTSFTDPNKEPVYGMYLFDDKTNAYNYYRFTCLGEYNNPKALTTFKVSYLKDGVACTANIRCQGLETNFVAMNHKDIEVEDKKANPSLFYPKTEDITQLLETFKSENLLNLARQNSEILQSLNNPQI